MCMQCIRQQSPRTIFAFTHYIRKELGWMFFGRLKWFIARLKLNQISFISIVIHDVLSIFLHKNLVKATNFSIEFLKSGIL